MKRTKYKYYCIKWRKDNYVFFHIEIFHVGEFNKKNIFADMSTNRTADMFFLLLFLIILYQQIQYDFLFYVVYLIPEFTFRFGVGYIVLLLHHPPQRGHHLLQGQQEEQEGTCLEVQGPPPVLRHHSLRGATTALRGKQQLGPVYIM